MGSSMVEKWIDKVHSYYEIPERLGKKKEGTVVLILFAALVFGVVCVFGTLTSGFHLVDDWEFAKYVDLMSPGRSKFWECMKTAVGFDLTLRLRPLYYINRVCMAAVFGMNLTAISAVKAAEIVIALFFLYWCARNMGNNAVYSMLFALTIMVGYQSPVWWKLGPQESYDIMMFAIAFYLMLKWLKTNVRGYMIGSLIAFFLMSVYKEPFILLIPFVMLYVVYEEMKGKKLSVEALWNSVKSRWGYLLTLGVIFVVEMILIVFVIGTNNYEYVGLDETISLSQYIETWNGAFHNNLKWYCRFGIIMGMILLTYWEQVKKLGWEILLTAAIILPQVVTYSKTAIEERYILPAVLGYAFFFILVGCNLKALSGKRRILYVMCLVLMLLAHGRVMIREAQYFTYRGRSVQAAMDKTLEIIQSNPDTKVLSCYGPNIEGNRTMYYWFRNHGFDEMWYWDEDRALISRWFGEREDEEEILDNMDVVVMYNKEDRHWCYEPSLDLSDFDETNLGTITMYVRRK